MTVDEEKILKILENQARMEQQIKTLFEQQADIKSLTETVHKLAVALETQGMSLRATEKTVTEVKADVDEIKSKPAKRWDAIIVALISGVVGFVLAKFGIK